MSYSQALSNDGGPDKGPFLLYNMIRMLKNRRYTSLIREIVKIVMDIGMYRMNVGSIGSEF